MIVFEADLCFTANVLFFTNFFATVSPSSTGRSVQNFARSWSAVGCVLKIGSKHLGELPQKILGAKIIKHAKIGSISDDFKLRRQISPERIYSKKIFKIREVHR